MLSDNPVCVCGGGRALGEGQPAIDRHAKSQNVYATRYLGAAFSATKFVIFDKVILSKKCGIQSKFRKIHSRNPLLL